jgi:hypothetical protein
MAGVYRADFAESTARQVVNPYLERALDGYYAKRSRLYTIAMATSFGIAALGVAIVLLANPEDGWLSAPSGLLVLPGGMCFVICGAVALAMRAHPLLDKLRTGIAIRRVRRGITPYVLRSGLIKFTKEVPTIFVEFTDGNAMSVASLGDVAQLARIEELLRKQQEQQCARL